MGIQQAMSYIQIVLFASAVKLKAYLQACQNIPTGNYSFYSAYNLNVSKVQPTRLDMPSRFECSIDEAEIR